MKGASELVPAGAEPTLGWLPRADRLRVRAVMLALILGGGVAVGALTAVKPQIGIGVAVILGFLLVVLQRLQVGGLVLVTLVPVLSGLKRGFPVPNLKLTELLTVAIAGTVLVTLRRVHGRAWTRVESMLLLYGAMYAGLSIYDARSLGTHLSLGQYGTALGPVQFFLLYRAIRLVLPSGSDRLLAIRLLLFASVPVSLLAILQQVNVPGVRSFITTVTGSTVFTSSGSGYQTFARATGPFPHWTPFAGYLTVILILGIALLLEPACQLMPRGVLAAILILDGVGLLLSAELSAIGSLVIAMILLAWWFQRLRFMLRAFGVAAVIFGIAAGPYLASRLHQQYAKETGVEHTPLPQTIQFRLHIWRSQYFPAIGDRPFDGYGVVQPSIVQWPDTESQYISSLATGGIPLLLGYVVMLVGLGTAGASLATDGDDPLRRVTGRSVVALSVVLVPMGAVFPYMDNAGMPQALWTVAAVMMATVPGRLPPTGLARARRPRWRIPPAQDAVLPG